MLKLFSTSLAIGEVWHKRYTPTIHEFKYKLNSFLIELNDPQSLKHLSKFTSFTKFNLYYLNENDYLRDYNGSIKSKVINKLVELGAILNGQEKLFMLGQLSNIGVYFSPLNLYICMINNECRYVLAEVSNTPWNQRHYYLIDMKNKPYIVKKEFHVSPFFNLNQNYHWTFNFTSNEIYFQIDSYQDKQKVFSAGYAVSLITLGNRNQVNRKLIKSPFNIFKILLAIYYNALKLFLKKVPFVPYRYGHKDKE